MRDGFVVVPGFLRPDEVAEVIENAERCVREREHGAPDTVAYYHDDARPESLYYLWPCSDPFFLAFGQAPRLKEVAAEILGEPVDAGHPAWLDKPPGYDDPTLPHQDLYYLWLVPPRGVMFWLALDEVDEENACLRFVRGSHERGVRPHGSTPFPLVRHAISDYGPADRALEVPAPARPGDLIAHDCRMIHRTDTNRSAERRRRAVVQALWGLSARHDPEDFECFLAAGGRSTS